jgi:hypothetical protein
MQSRLRAPTLAKAGYHDENEHAWTSSAVVTKRTCAPAPAPSTPPSSPPSPPPTGPVVSLPFSIVTLPSNSRVPLMFRQNGPRGHVRRGVEPEPQINQPASRSISIRVYLGVRCRTVQQVRAAFMIQTEESTPLRDSIHFHSPL